MSITFELPDPAYEQYTWVYENEHGPASQPPLMRGSAFGERAGGDGPPRRLVINGYGFYRSDPSGEMPMPFAIPNLAGASALGRWREYWQPQVEALFDQLMAFDPRSVAPGAWQQSLKAQSDEFSRVFAGVHGESVVTSGRLADEFVTAYAAHFGEAHRADALALLQGFENCTLDRALALWDLSRTVREDAALRAVLERGERPSGGEFAEDFAAFLEEFGYTIDTGVADAPTWLEDRSPAIALVLRYAAQSDDAGPGPAPEAQRARRQALEAALRAAAATDEAAAALLRQLPAAQELLPVREDHNTICDQRLGAASRFRWLRVGEHLVERGLVADPSEVFYHELPELYRALDESVPVASATLAERTALQSQYRAALPPPFLGQPLAGVGEGSEVAGTAASPGQYRGRARVIRALAEADRLADGEVLVCGVTQPSWTPYFALAGAVVTDAGGALSTPPWSRASTASRRWWGRARVPARSPMAQSSSSMAPRAQSRSSLKAEAGGRRGRHH